MLYRMLLCLLLGFSLVACEAPPPPPPPPVHVTGFPVGHPLNPLPTEAQSTSQAQPVDESVSGEAASASHPSFSGAYVGANGGGAVGD